jgi:hypothetical protein
MNDKIGIVSRPYTDFGIRIPFPQLREVPATKKQRPAGTEEQRMSIV